MRTVIILSIVALATVNCTPQGGSLDDLIGNVFKQPGGGNTGTGPTPGNNNVDIIPQGTGCGVGEECVPHYLCSNSQVVKDGTGLIDIRFDGDAPPKQCTNYLEECCSVDKKVTDPIITPKPTPDGCGYRNIDGVGFKITGDKQNETQYGEFPWMVAILKEEKAGDQTLNIYQCGGSLIHPRVVLTGAHCVFGKSPNILKIRAGEWDTQVKTELFPHQDRTVAEVITHPHYNKGSLYNDIALLVLTSPVELADNVKTVCLPPAKTKFDYTRCIATGWGKDTFGKEGKYQVILKKIDLPVVPRDQCQAALRGTRLGQHFELHRSFICAGGEPGKDTCKGDGGSPLVCPIGNTERYMQAGIVAWGIGCNEQYPGVYASVAELRPWLDEQLEYLKVERSYFTA